MRRGQREGEEDVDITRGGRAHYVHGVGGEFVGLGKMETVQKRERQSEVSGVLGWSMWMLR